MNSNDREMQNLINDLVKLDFNKFKVPTATSSLHASNVKR